MIRYGSLCSGIEAATAAWHPLGWDAAFLSENDIIASRFLAAKYPDTPNYGDMTKFEDWPDHAIDVLVGGTPCQSFSVAGLRGGLNDARGNLMLVYCAVARRYRPKWLVWENVPGVLSSNGGRDFASLLGILSGRRIEAPADGWRNAGFVQGINIAYGLAWRVLDAQYVRVDSHRVAVPQRRRRVFVIGYLGDWRRAAAVLFERQGLSRNFAPRRNKGKELANRIENGTDGGRGAGVNPPMDYLIPSISMCLTTGSVPRQDPETSTIISVITRGPDVINVAGTMKASTLVSRSADEAAGGYIIPYSPSAEHGVKQEWAARRLTPRECIRLQGFPDDYLDAPRLNKPLSDAAKYKLLGNSMAVNVMSWIGRRIAAVSAITTTSPTLEKPHE